MKTKGLIYREKWQDMKFNKLFIGFKHFISASEVECAQQCAEIIIQQLPDPIHVLDLGAGDGIVSLGFLEALSRSRQVSSYMATDFSTELVKILRSKKKDFKRYTEDIRFGWEDATTFIPSTRPHLIVAFNSWYGIPFREIPRYLSLLEPGGILAILLNSRDSITLDLTVQFKEPMYSVDDLVEWLNSTKLFYTRHKVVSQHLQRSDFLRNITLNPEGEVFFRYLLRRIDGSLEDIVPYLYLKPELYFKIPQELIVLEKQSINLTTQNIYKN